VRLGRLWDDMARGLATVTRAPAEAAGLSDRGALIEGRRADVIRFGERAGVPMVQGVWVRGARVA
jgi:alpha-D-ribose 1-methylphosphonate 5-triphosphate diphosphatase